MSSALHTVGPLTVRPSAALCSHNGDVGIVNRKGSLIAVAISRPADGEALASAHLFAAAPELLAAAERIEKRIAYYASMADGEQPNIEQWAYTDQSGDVAALRAAIAKAAGAAA